MPPLSSQTTWATAGRNDDHHQFGDIDVALPTHGVRRAGHAVISMSLSQRKFPSTSPTTAPASIATVYPCLCPTAFGTCPHRGYCQPFRRLPHRHHRLRRIAGTPGQSHGSDHNNLYRYDHVPQCAASTTRAAGALTHRHVPRRNRNGHHARKLRSNASRRRPRSPPPPRQRSAMTAPATSTIARPKGQGRNHPRPGPSPPAGHCATQGYKMRRSNGADAPPSRSPPVRQCTDPIGAMYPPTGTRAKTNRLLQPR